MKIAALSLMLIGAAPAPAPIHVWTVPELSDALTVQRDKVVLVRGWIVGCLHGLRIYSTCAVASDRQGDGPQLNLGMSRSLEAGLRNVSGRQVVLRVRVIGRCNRPDDPETEICLENSSDVVALRVVSVSKTGS